MTETPNKQYYDLEERTLRFAKNIRVFVKNVPKNLTNFDDLKQLVRSSGSTGANYIEANESLSKKDFLMRIKICRKEAKESSYWLNFIEIRDANLIKTKQELIQETTELKKIFSKIIVNCK